MGIRIPVFFRDLMSRIMTKPLAREERKKQLLDAAITCFGQKGYHATQISDIIETAGVARGTFYLYFQGKREIFDYVMTELFGQVQKEIKTIPKEALSEIPNQIRGNIKRVLTLLMNNPLLAKILMSESVGLDEELDSRLRTFYNHILNYIRRGLNQGQEMGFVREGHIEIMAVSLLGCMKEVLYQHLLGTEKATPDEMTEEIYRMVIGAVQKQ